MIICPYCGDAASVPDCTCTKCGPLFQQDDLPIVGLSAGQEAEVFRINFFYFFAVSFLRKHGCFQLDGLADRLVLAKLPWAIQSGYRLVVLESEVLNGGFHQWLTNSSGQYIDETLADLRLIGATNHVEIVQQVITLAQTIREQYPNFGFCQRDLNFNPSTVDDYWNVFEVSFAPVFDKLDRQFYQLSDQHHYWPLFDQYISVRPGLCVFQTDVEPS